MNTLTKVDPNNKHWANDTSRYGFKMLEKMGWSHGKGLGANENGTTKHIPIVRKDDNKGIGANGIDEAWLETGREYQRVLDMMNDDDDVPLETLREKQVSVYKPPRVLRSKLAVSSYTADDMNAIFGVTQENIFAAVQDDDEHIHKSTVTLDEYFKSKKRQRVESDDDVQREVVKKRKIESSDDAEKEEKKSRKSEKKSKRKSEKSEKKRTSEDSEEVEKKSKRKSEKKKSDKKSKRKSEKKTKQEEPETETLSKKSKRKSEKKSKRKSEKKSKH
eukprot:TRINITY_DN206_c0_g1_i2.p1 TRINITY_DN206_c0_g1~~TRINITY_DN206_c0_g1_i2.p1  ORF type:complete len:275 (+),score=102.62 TRINITY_DN206_c0_g1_i2:111-935(+)